MQARREDVDHLRVADQLERDEPERSVDVVFANFVDVALDRDEDEVVDGADVGERARDRVRLRKIEPDPTCRAADLAAAVSARDGSLPVTITSRPSSA